MKLISIASTSDASKTFHEIPAQLTNNASKYPRWNTTDGLRNSELAEIISEIKETMGGSMPYRTHSSIRFTQKNCIKMEIRVPSRIYDNVSICCQNPNEL